jgi:hypothetical protein
VNRKTKIQNQLEKNVSDAFANVRTARDNKRHLPQMGSKAVSYLNACEDVELTKIDHRNAKAELDRYHEGIKLEMEKQGVN